MNTFENGAIVRKDKGDYQGGSMSEYERRVLQDLKDSRSAMYRGAAYNKAVEALIGNGYLKRDELGFALYLTEKGVKEDG